ncbi:Uu.00g078470.m01.CDS01 [Anthostomella pinea]|uniref:Uu.00g078470.m01.CDS01 n=1 Tax=Anthostomella pinea TaxID=933095 RepID=A0AAI8YJ12_9PEZI|nr:Uu.00g078470.m01.CDS01 [Anthostomella pinea]
MPEHINNNNYNSEKPTMIKMSNVLNQPTAGDCTGFDGNPDLYGLGIRIGVYLQWYSSWLSMTLTPHTAAETHTANTISMFAIIIAVLQSADTGSIRPVEAWLMYQICLGYMFTVVGIFGLRLRLLRPSTLGPVLAAAIRRIKNLRNRFKPDIRRTPRAPAEGPRGLFAPTDVPSTGNEFWKVRLSELAFLRDSPFSWAGSLWRSTTFGLVMATNIWLLAEGTDTLQWKVYAVEPDTSSFSLDSLSTGVLAWPFSLLPSYSPFQKRFAKAAHEAFLSGIEHFYKDWDQVDIELLLDGSNVISARPVSRRAGQNPDTSLTPTRGVLTAEQM